MSNSSLVVYKKISPNKTSPRNHKIDTLAIHCMVGQLTAESCGSIFAKSSSKASSNYGVDKDGRIAMYVEEKDRSWCTSSAAVDNRAITIEVASDTKDPYRVNDVAYNSLIELCVDICKRNNIKKLVWSTDKNTRVNHLNGANMEVHRDHSYKSCPGDYLYNRMGDIANKVNERLNVVITEGWQEDSHGWWYQYTDGSYPKSCWKTINGKDYYFKADGYMAVNEYIKASDYETTKKIYWVNEKGEWNNKSYRWMFNNKGYWIAEIGGSWYPVNEWAKVDGKWYYFDASGYMVTGVVVIDGVTYNFRADGSLIE